MEQYKHFQKHIKCCGYDNKDIKILYGVEAYLAPDNTKSIYNGKGQDIDATYCVLDLETTGFSATNDRITEIEVGGFSYYGIEIGDEKTGIPKNILQGIRSNGIIVDDHTLTPWDWNGITTVKDKVYIYFDKCNIASNTPPATHLALSDI